MCIILFIYLPNTVRIVYSRFHKSTKMKTNCVLKAVFSLEVGCCVHNKFHIPFVWMSILNASFRLFCLFLTIYWLLKSIKSFFLSSQSLSITQTLKAFQGYPFGCCIIYCRRKYNQYIFAFCLPHTHYPIASIEPTCSIKVNWII